MKFSEMKAQLSGLPEGFNGQRAKWTEVTVPFEILKACLLREPQLDSDGEIIVSPKTGKPYFDYNLAMMIRLESGNELIVRTNSPKLIPVFRPQIENRPADGVNRYGTEFFLLEVPSGKVRFTAVKHDYGNKGKQDVAYLEDVEN